MRIFISSKYRDLKEERKSAIVTIDRIKNGIAIAMEKFFASRHPSKEVCLNHLHECDAVVLIFGFHYGSIDKEEGISMTEIEYNRAKTLGLPVFVFQKRQADGRWRSEEIDPDRNDKLSSFKTRLDEERYRRPFQTPQELAFEIIGAIHEYEIENGIIGVRLPAFTSFDDFFKPFVDEKKLFNHLYPFVGRKEYLEFLDNFIESEKRIALFHGRGGIGKSKVLYEFGSDYEIKHGEWQLRFLREGVTLSDDTIRQLPAQKCIIVVDDAHRRLDLSLLFAMAQQYSDRVKIILSCRPQGLDYLRGALTRGGFDNREIENISEIKELGQSELEELGRIILGKNHEQFLEPLIQVAKDSTLVLVIGGRLVAEGAIDPRMLERHNEFHRSVFDRFQDTLIGQISDKLGAELCRNILSLISALSPIQPQKESFQEYASDFLDIHRVKLIDAIGILENNGVLLRRGFSLRITPDVLSDHVLYNACVSPMGKPTGYAQKVFNSFGHIFLEKVLFNLSELDWRITREGKPIDLLNEIWGILEGIFKEATHFQRTLLLKCLEKVAYYQPARTLRLIEYAIHNPSNKTSDDKWDSLYKFSNKNVLNKIPPLLRGIAFNLDYLPRCCDLLWYLGRDDERPTSQYLEHAIRILSDLAGYDLYKPLHVTIIVLDAIERWLKEPNIYEYIHSPLEILEPMLDKEGDTSKIRGNSVDIIPFAVTYDVVKSLREKIISILSDCTKSSSIKVVLRASKILIDALNPPRGLFGRIVSDDEINRWLSEEMKILEVMEDLVKTTKDPLVHIQVALDLQWHVKRSHQKIISGRAESIIKAIPDSFDLRITKAIWKQFDRDFADEDYHQYQERITEEIKQTVAEFIKFYNDGEEAFNFFNRILSTFENCGIQAQPGEFLYLLSVMDNELSFQICKYIITNPSSPLSFYLNFLLSGIREKNSSKTIELTKLAVETSNGTLCYSIAIGYAGIKWASSIKDEEISVLQILLKHPDVNVKNHAIQALGRFSATKVDKAIKLALSINIGDDEKLADTLCGVFNSQHGIPPDQVNTEELTAILLKFIQIKEINNRLYYLDKFIRYCSSRIPEAVVNFFLKRLDIAEEKIKISETDYHPLPYLSFHYGLKNISSSPNFSDLLKKVRDRALNRKEINYFWLPKLYAELSNGFCSVSLDVLSEWIDSADSKKIEAVGLLVKNAPSDFIFSHSEFVLKLLEKAYMVSEDCYQITASRLSSSAFSGMRSGRPGQPKPQDIKLRDQAIAFSKKFPIGSPTQRFYFDLVKRAEASIRVGLARDEELLEEL